MHIPHLRRFGTGSAIVLAGICAGAAPAHAASISDGTSNTLQVSLNYTFENVMVESLIGAPPRSPR